MRDSQRSKVYRAENKFWKEHVASSYHTDSREELEAQVVAIWEDAAVQRVFPALAGTRVPEVRFSRKVRGAFATPILHRLTFSPTGNAPWLVLHEMAHLVHPIVVRSAYGDQAAHGPEWCRMYLQLVEACYGFETREGLGAAFRAERVNITPRVVKKR